MSDDGFDDLTSDHFRERPVETTANLQKSTGNSSKVRKSLIRGQSKNCGSIIGEVQNAQNPRNLNMSSLSGMHMFQYQTYQQEDDVDENKNDGYPTGNDEDVTKGLSAEDALVANRIQAKNSILTQTTPDIQTKFEVKVDNHGNTEPLPERYAIDNQKMYLKKYAINIELPSIYVIDAQINNVFPNYCFQLVKCVLPTRETHIVNTTFTDGKSQTSMFDKIYCKYKQGLILRLLRRDKSQLIQEREVILEGIFKAQMKFSQCGTLFALVVPQDEKNSVPEQIRICKMVKNDIYDFIHQLNHKKYTVHYPQLFAQNERILGQLKNQPSFVQSIQNIAYTERVVFDKNLRYLVCYGGSQMLIFQIEKNKSVQYKINQNIYDQIYDVQIKSSSEDKYECYVACQKKIINQIVVFDFFEYIQKLSAPQNKKSAWEVDRDLHTRMSLNFAERPSKYMKVTISSDFKQVVFTDFEENFILEKKDGYTVQKKLVQLEDKVSHYTKQSPYDEQGFYFIECKDYDKSLKIIHSDREKKICKILRNVEPDIIKIFDMQIISRDSKIEGYTKRIIRVLSMRDDEFIYDYLKYDEKLIEQDVKLQRKAVVPKQVFDYQNMYRYGYIFSSLRAFSTSWPYVAFAGFSNYIILVNAFDRKFIQRIQLADDSQRITICDTYITDTYDLFVLLQNQDQYKLYMIDLDAANVAEFDGEDLDDDTISYKLGDPIFQYQQEDVESRQFLKMYIRGSSRKEKFDKNEKLYVYFLHSGKIYCWTQLTKYSRYDTIQLVSTTSSTRLQEIKNGQYIFLQDEYDKNGKTCRQNVIKLQTNFSMYQLITYISRASDSNDKIQEICMDHSINMILILIQTKPIGSGESDQTLYKLKLFDIQQNKTIFEVRLTFEVLIGRIKSGLYQVNQGHIYYNNNFIKMRYDLINSPKNYKYRENELFDFYYNIFDLGESIQIRSGTPIDSIRYHRFIYVTRDKQMKLAQKIMILPYLHERRIYLNRIMDNTSYFYTSIDTPWEFEKRYNQMVRQAVGKNITKNSLEFELALQGMKKKQDDNVEKSAASIICMNITQSKYYVYDTNGILQNRVNFEEYQKEFGHPIATSSNGQYFIFKKNIEDVMQLKNLSPEQMIESYMTIYIFKLSIFRFKKMKKINILNNAKENLLQNKNLEAIANLEWLFEADLETFEMEIDTKIVVNDKMHVCVRINKKTCKEYDENGERFDRHKCQLNYEGSKEQEAYQMYYFENCLFNLMEVDEAELEAAGQLISVLVTNQHGGYDFLINRLYIFFWQDANIQYGLLSQGIHNENEYTVADFSMDDFDTNSYIKDLRTGSNPEIFIFAIQQSSGFDSIYTWFTKENAEAEAYDVHGQWEILWDKLGNLYIVNGKKVILNGQRCCVKSFDFDLPDKSKMPKSSLSNARGHRFDFKNHNWLIFSQYISLPFSYITFVIKDKIERKDPMMRLNQFDPEPYNYIFNKGTCFTDGDFVKHDYEQLQNVLENFHKNDPDLLELLVYNQTLVDVETKKFLGFNTPLFMAVQAHNNKSADIILEYMSKINFNSSRNIMSVISKLVNYKKFMKYLKELPVQTPLMQTKQVIRVSSTYDDKIVSFKEASCIQIDDEFYRDVMLESPLDSTGYKSYPVKTIALRIAWILDQPEGKQFLWSIYNNHNLNYYKIPSVYLIVEFLYSKYKSILLKWLLPAFILQSIFFQAMVFCLESYAKILLDNQTEPDQDGVIWLRGNEETSPFKVLSVLFLILTWLLGIFLFYSYFLLYKNMGKAYFRSFYNILDCIMILMMTIVSILVIYQLSGDNNPTTFDNFKGATKARRNLEAIFIFIIYVKAGYFMSLVDATAPLVDNISSVIFDIRYFIFILIIQVIAFASSFFIIGQNQLDFDNISAQSLRKKGFAYKTFGNAIWYVYYNFVLTSKNYSFFDMGEKSQRLILFFMFICGQTYIVAILLNMLIALMQKTFSERRIVAEQVQIKDHLKFVLDNWHLMDYALTNKKRIKYIIACLLHDDNQSQDANFNEVKEEIKAIDQQSQENFNKLQHKIFLNTIIVSSLQKDNEDEAKQRKEAN